MKQSLIILLLGLATTASAYLFTNITLPGNWPVGDTPWWETNSPPASIVASNAWRAVNENMRRASNAVYSNYKLVTNMTVAWAHSATLNSTSAPSGTIAITPGFHTLAFYFICTNFVSSPSANATVGPELYWNNGLVQQQVTTTVGPHEFHANSLGYDSPADGTNVAPFVINAQTNSLAWKLYFGGDDTDFDAAGYAVITVQKWP